MSAESLASVAYLAPRANTEIYRSFHEQFVGKGASILLNRVVHIDKTGDRSVHLMVVQQENPAVRMMPAQPWLAGNIEPHYRTYYSPDETFVATTDGEIITQYHTLSVYGLYRGSICKKYDPMYEQMHIDFALKDGGLESGIDFNIATGDGHLSLNGRVLGWILGAEESYQIRQIALTPEINPPIHGTEAS